MYNIQKNGISFSQAESINVGPGTWEPQEPQERQRDSGEHVLFDVKLIWIYPLH